MKKYRIRKKNVLILAGIILLIAYIIINPSNLIAKNKLKKLGQKEMLVMLFVLMLDMIK